MGRAKIQFGTNSLDLEAFQKFGNIPGVAIYKLTTNHAKSRGTCVQEGSMTRISVKRCGIVYILSNKTYPLPLHDPLRLFRNCGCHGMCVSEIYDTLNLVWGSKPENWDVS